MSCINKSFSKKVQEKHNLSPYFAEFFFQLYNIKYGEDSEFDENKFDEIINSYKNRESFIVDDNELFDNLMGTKVTPRKDFIKEHSAEGGLYNAE